MSTMTPRSITTDNLCENSELLISLLNTLESIDRRLRIIEGWINEWEAADALVEQVVAARRDKTRDH